MIYIDGCIIIYDLLLCSVMFRSLQFYRYTHITCNTMSETGYAVFLLSVCCVTGVLSDLQGVKTYAKQDGSDWILNGSKTFITNGWMSDVVIVVAVTNPTAKSIAHGISLFLVDEGMPGYKKGCKLEKMGFKAQVGAGGERCDGLIVHPAGKHYVVMATGSDIVTLIN